MSDGLPRIRLSPWFLIALVGATAASFIVASRGRSLSPDETANGLFARQFAQQGTVAIAPPDAALAGLVGPRSTVVRGDGSLVPASFVAFPVLLGAVGRLLGTQVIPLLPWAVFLVSVGSVARLSRWYFGPRAARLAVLFYALHPVVLFYASRPLWHNGLFLWLLLIGWSCLVETKRRSSRWWLALGALLVSLAVAVRPSELVWVALFGFGVLVSLRPLPPRWWAWLFLPPLAIAALLLWLQDATYGQALALGYAPEHLRGDTPVALARSFADRVTQLVLPFGLKLGPALGLAGTFLVRWAFLPTALGVVGVFANLRSSAGAKRPLAAATLIVSLWLMIFYGSSDFSETFTRSQIGLGSSYLRYWLPGLALLALFAPAGLDWLRERGVMSSLGLRLLVVAAVALGLQAWLVDPEYGLVKARQRDLADLATVRSEIIATVPARAVVAAGPLDKALVPDRLVVGYSVLSQAQADQLVRVVERGWPIYLVSADADEIRRAEQTFAAAGRQLVYRRTLTGGYRLYVAQPGEGAS